MITVVIPTLGRRALALDAVRSVAGQVGDTPFEVLVLDNGCDSLLADSIHLVARRCCVPVLYIPVPAVGLHNARHEAARQAHGDILAYLDDDVVVEAGWLAALASTFLDPDVHLVGGRCLPVFEGAVPSWLEAFVTRNDDGTWWCGLLTLVDLGPDAKDVDPLRVWGANFAVRKETLIRAGGFHPDGLPWHLRRFRGDGETAVSIALQKLCLRAAYSPGATVRHRVPRERLTQEYFERRAFLQGVSASFSAARCRDGDEEARPRFDFTRRLRGRVDSLAVKRKERRKLPRSWQTRKSKVTAAQAAGYAYHQEQLWSDPAVRAWVRRPDYWSARVPDPHDRTPTSGGDTVGATRLNTSG